MVTERIDVPGTPSRRALGLPAARQGAMLLQYWYMLMVQRFSPGESDSAFVHPRVYASIATTV